MPKDYVISVMSVDRVGIVAGLTEAVLELGGSIDAISQTVLLGYFTIILAARFEEALEPSALAAAVRAKGARGEWEVSVQERRALAPAPVVAAPQGASAQRFILTLSGPDRKGVIHRISSYLASRNINVEDLYAYREGPRFVLLAQVQVPADLELERLQMDVASIWAPGDMHVTLQHENIFLATNNIDFRSAEFGVRSAD
jgi:glycine cleavage system transcriptional repressor